MKKIIPVIKKCKCGKQVKNHHFLCDDCWGEKAKKKNQKESQATNLRGIIARKKKLGETPDASFLNKLEKLQ